MNRNKETASAPWRWLVAFAACWIMFCIMSLFRSYGVIYVAVLQTYGLTRQEASWPFSVCGAVLNCTAFIPGMLSSFLSNRQIVLLGSVTSSFGIILCYFASDLAWIVAFFGIFYGLGMGIVIPPLLVLLNKNFVKFRATACGICFTGAALSSIIFPPVTDLILEEYGLRGTFLLLGGLVLNTLVGTALLQNDSTRDIKLNSTPMKCSFNKRTYISENEERLTSENEHNFTQSSENTLNNEEARKTLFSEQQFCQIIRDEDNNVTEKSHFKESTADDQNFPIAFRGTSNTRKAPSICRRIGMGMRDYFLIVRFLMTDGIFYITTISSTCGWMAYFTFSMVIVDYGLDQGVGKSQAVVLVSIYSATEIAGRLCTGWVSDMGLMRRKDIMWFTSFTSGLVLLGFPFCKTALLLNLLTGLYGLLVGCFIILYSVLLADYLGIEKLAVATSLMFFFGGSLTLLRPLLVGYFRDSSGCYHNLFYILAAMSLIGGSIWLLEPIIMYYRRKKQKTLNTNTL